jgi:hypothetical protein
MGALALYGCRVSTYWLYWPLLKARMGESFGGMHMDRRNQPVEFWGEGIAFWWRLWQSQIEYSLRFWGSFAERMPHPNAADLSAEAEAMREISQRREREWLPADRRPRKPVDNRLARQVH